MGTTSERAYDTTRDATTAPDLDAASLVQRSTALARASHRSRTGQAADIQRALTAQRTGGEDTDAVHHAAAHGISDGGGALPHLDAIQRSFGRHDVSSVQAHVGGKAADASAAMGAQAYATGSDVAFAQSPDLHTAAHEAAHIVQQRAGVALKGGVGQAGDPYERHADAVADRVVQGESAVDLLDQMAPAPGASHGAIQRKDDDVEQTDPTATCEAEPAPPTPNQYGRVGHVTPYLALRAEPEGQEIDDTNRQGLEVARLNFDDRVQIISEGPGDWLHLRTDAGEEGYASRLYIFRHPPEPNARLYKTKSGDTALGIAQRHFDCGEWGADGRFYTNVLVHLNGGGGNPEKGIYKSDADASWKTSKVKAGYYIWLPDPTFARSLHGVVDSGSISYEAFGAARDLTAFAAGLATGLWDGLVDAIMGVVDLLALIWDVLSSTVQSLIADIKAFWDALKKLDLGALLDAFADRWNNPDPWEKYKFRGWVVGFAIMLIAIEILLAVTTGGVGNAARWATKLAKLSKLDKLVDALRGTTAVQKLTKNVSKVADTAKDKLRDLERLIDPKKAPETKKKPNTDHDAKGTDQPSDGPTKEHTSKEGAIDETREPLESERDTEAPHSKASFDVDEVAKSLRSADNVSDPHKMLDGIVRDARLGQEGAIGELKALDRWAREGRQVELLPEVDRPPDWPDDQPHRNPDFRVDGKITEVKTSAKRVFQSVKKVEDYIKGKIRGQNHQIKNSRFANETGEAVIQLDGDAIKMMSDGDLVDVDLATIEKGVAKQFRVGQSKFLDTVSVYKEGELLGRWQRTANGIERVYP